MHVADTTGLSADCRSDDPRYGSSTLACCGRRKTAYNRPVALGNEGSSAPIQSSPVATQHGGTVQAHGSGLLQPLRASVGSPAAMATSFPSPLSHYQPVGEPGS